ncbi:MAG: tryptophan--tRNA ligase [Dehalococcoidales bacterium]|nr:tryptophan--tRNA ligase [Dehalococcoidales bacterium]
MKKRVFSGIQPTGNIHIGNYIGATRHWAADQDIYDNIFCIVDLHAITIQQDPKQIKSKIREVTGLLLAAGIDPQKSIVFVQSHVHEHSELAWILNCFIPMGWMGRMTQYKEKSSKQKEQVSVGLFDYPALMAADILLYDTDVVPVGEDQKQHVELTRDAALRFNNIYGDIFTVPEPRIAEIGARIMGLDDPTKKMSKSEEAPNHAIALLDPPDVIQKKIMRATTDSETTVVFDEKRPGIYNLLTIYKTFTGEKDKDIEAKFAGKGYGDFKKALAEVVIEGLRPLQERYQKITGEAGYIDKVLAEGAAKAHPLAQKTLAKVQKAVGLG